MRRRGKDHRLWLPKPVPGGGTGLLRPKFTSRLQTDFSLPPSTNMLYPVLASPPGKGRATPLLTPEHLIGTSGSSSLFPQLGWREHLLSTEGTSSFSMKMQKGGPRTGHRMRSQVAWPGQTPRDTRAAFLSVGP